MENNHAPSVAVPHSAPFDRCEQEPIATPGAIQPHGALIAVDGVRACVSHLSANVETMLGLPSDALLAMTPQSMAEALHMDPTWAFADKPAEQEVEVSLRRARASDGRPLTVQRLAYGDHIFFELEPALDDEPGSSTMVAQALGRLRCAEDRPARYREALSVIRELTEYDRVVMYVFDAAWHGEVVAESVRPGCAEYLGYHFPNSDIPAQARAMYAKTSHRAVVDVDYEAVPLICADATWPPLDMTHCSLRSLSPFHREYMRNFNARSSLSFSVMLGDRLFGLISCNHEQGSKWVSAERRAACVCIAEMLSGMLDSEVAAQAEDPALILAPSLVRKMATLADISEVLLGAPPNMLNIADASGAAIYYNDQLSSCGDVPPHDALLRLIAWLKLQDLSDGVYVTDSLPSVFSEATAYRACACGLLAVISPEQPSMAMLWFRGEISRHIDWGGMSPKQAGHDKPPSMRPRSSFARWQEAVVLHAEPFLNQEIANTKRLAREVEQSIVRQSLHLNEANAALERSNQELGAFAHAASHDLKEPLRGVHNFVALAQRELAEGQSASTIAPRLQTVTKLIDRMNALISALMHYAEVGVSQLDLQPTPLGPLVASLLDTLRRQPNHRRIDFEIPDNLPTVLADQTLLSEVFTNLFTNAIKYNEQKHVQISVGVAPCDTLGMVTLFVRDNGIGVPSELQDEIFAIFRRLHARDKFGGGSGTGLTIAKRIVESHGGGHVAQECARRWHHFFLLDTQRKEGGVMRPLQDRKP